MDFQLLKTPLHSREDLVWPALIFHDMIRSCWARKQVEILLIYCPWVCSPWNVQAVFKNSAGKKTFLNITQDPSTQYSKSIDCYLSLLFILLMYFFAFGSWKNVPRNDHLSALRLLAWLLSILLPIFIYLLRQIRSNQNIIYIYIVILYPSNLAYTLLLQKISLANTEHVYVNTSSYSFILYSSHFDGYISDHIAPQYEEKFYINALLPSYLPTSENKLGTEIRQMDEAICHIWKKLKFSNLWPVSTKVKLYWMNLEYRSDSENTRALEQMLTQKPLKGFESFFTYLRASGSVWIASSFILFSSTVVSSRSPCIS